MVLDSSVIERFVNALTKAFRETPTHVSVRSINQIGTGPSVRVDSDSILVAWPHSYWSLVVRPVVALIWTRFPRVR